MHGFHLYTSNRIELLADKLAEILSHEPPPPMAQEIIVIPSGGMERFVSFTLANRQQICANTYFPFPNAFIHYIFKTLFPDIRERSLFSQEILTWKIMELLPAFLNKKGFEQISQYVSNDPTQVKLFQLSGKIAYLFDQYTVFRPEMIQAWESGKISSGPDEQWQAELWRNIVENIQDDHRARLRKILFDKLKKSNHEADNLPKRISLFSISYLPRFHLDILHALSKYTDINLFALNPCSHFWDDIISEKRIAKKTLQFSKDITSLHYETGNSLLASLGTYGKDFFTLLHNLECEEHSEFIEPDGKTMLSMLLSDILNLRSRESPVTVSDKDRSIQIHVCHSPLREIEALHDNLLSFFEQDTTLLPNDIVVMTPDIDAYVPFIQTVFDNASDTSPYIPYTIADMTPLRSNRIINDFFAILDLKKSRFSATGVLSILESDAIQNRMGLTEDDISVIHTWIDNTNIRWGIDKHDRKQAGMPSTAENTWQAGLDRLFLGYAMSTDADSLFNTILPYESIEGSDAEILGKFSMFLGNLFDFIHQLDTERTLEQWAELLLRIANRFFESDESNEQYLETLRKIIVDLSEQEQSIGFNKKIPFMVIRSYLESSLSKKEYGKGFMTGGITFCNMLPMRSIPFKIICLIGMNDGSFPRSDFTISFDLISSNQRIGDRSVRKEDRCCFLESLLSARQVLYMSYIGHSIKDNSSIPPSVLISELIDYITQSFTLSSSNGAKLVEHITTHHRLNAFSREYFLKDKQQKLFSYSQENAEAAGAQVSEPEKFIGAPLPLPEGADWKRISIEQLCSFFTHPVKYFLKNRLGLSPAEAQSIISNTEPFSIDGLDKYLLEQKLLDKRLSSEEAVEQYNAAQASGILPHGTPGACTYNRICETIDSLASSLSEIDMKPAVKPFVDIETVHSGFTITGRIGTLTKENLIHYRTARIKAKDRLRIWISHLILNVLNDDILPCTSMLFGKETGGQTQCIQYTGVENAEELLEMLLNLYQKGLTKPIPFYPATSYVFADAIKSGKTYERAFEQARNEWQGNQYRPGESDNTYYAIYPGITDTFNTDFAEMAIQVYTPVFLHEQQVNI